MNDTNEDLTTEMKEATLPVITMYQGDQELNELHGYVTEMDAAYMRDTITPVGEDRKLPIVIQTNQTAVDTISYEIRSLDATRLIANADVTSYEERSGKITADLQIQNLLEEGEEYLMIIRLGSGDRSICYYTRIAEPVDCYVSECVAFVKDFNDKTFNDETSGTLATYMERTTGDNTTLQFVSLNSSLKQVSWADFKGERLTEPVPSIKEITPTYNVIVLDYVVSSVNESGQIEYYNIEEYYRVRYTTSRIYLLNFERTMNQIFRGENDSVYDQYIQLGIREANVEYKANEAGTSVAFVQEGELWSYNTVENTLAKVFSFRGYEGIDSRENYGEHDIKIVGVDEAGSVDYIVYGYMNRGIHEGEVGIAVYHYDSLANTDEELVFIPSDKSYEVMKSELGQLMYVNEGGELFLMLDGCVYGIDLNTLSVRELVTNLSVQDFAVSASNRYFAWMETEGDSQMGSSVIHVMNLSDQSTQEIAAGTGEAIKPLGFMDEDFVYGIARQSDIFEDAAGNVTFPMHQIRIVDVSTKDLIVQKTYEKSGYFVSSVSIEDYTMHLNRIQYNGTAYVPADQDMIMNREGDTEEKVTVGSTVTDRKETQYQLMMKNGADASKIKMLTSKSVLLENPRDVSVKNKESQEYFYVYKKGDVLFATDEIADAIVCANNHMGVVVDSKQQYVWMRARKSAQTAFSSLKVNDADKSSSSVVQAVSAMLNYRGNGLSVKELIDNGGTPKSAIENTLKDSVVLDISGCTVEEILFYVSKGSPVFAMTGTDSAVLVTGYTSGSIYYYDPQTHSTRSKSYKDADDWFRKAGYIFFTYLDR